MHRLADNACYFLPHGTLQFLLAAPIAVLPALIKDKRLGVSEALVDVALSAGTAANAVGKMVNGLAIDAVGANVFASAILACAACAVATFSATVTKSVLLIAFVLLQFAASGGWLIGCRVIHDTFAKEQWGGCFAILSVASRTGSMASKLGLGAFLMVLNWHEIGLVASCFGFVMCCLVSSLIARSAKTKGVGAPDDVDASATLNALVVEHETATTSGPVAQHKGDDVPTRVDASSPAPDLAEQDNVMFLLAPDTDATNGRHEDNDNDVLALRGSQLRRSRSGTSIPLEDAPRTPPAVSTATFARVRRLLCDRGLLLYSGVCAGATCVAGFENLCPLILGDLTTLSSAHISMTATVFPASLLLGVTIVPWLLNRAETRLVRDAKKASYSRLGAELCLLVVAFCSAVALSVIAARHEKMSPLVIVPFIFGLAFGVSVTFYITPNVYALEFGGEACATASSILDTFGLAAGSVWNLAASAIQRSSRSTYDAWTSTMLLLALIIIVTAVLAFAALVSTQTTNELEATAPTENATHRASSNLHRRPVLHSEMTSSLIAGESPRGEHEVPRLGSARVENKLPSEWRSPSNDGVQRPSGGGDIEEVI
ncbi:hypothetical protein CTAYLR_002903 [Chrysophaeum taylorii]|uniref:Uncharacterized protein n=1 Tax=Chrysophaeum taylorii TaxID=2483200 RepID=A0AAD7UM30_9STRA|nr:hypothetical protein CTAYLR_002903 [Chrysophaeum taylorii]